MTIRRFRASTSCRHFEAHQGCLPMEITDIRSISISSGGLPSGSGCILQRFRTLDGGLCGSLNLKNKSKAPPACFPSSSGMPLAQAGRSVPAVCSQGPPSRPVLKRPLRRQAERETALRAKRSGPRQAACRLSPHPIMPNARTAIPGCGHRAFNGRSGGKSVQPATRLSIGRIRSLPASNTTNSSSPHANSRGLAYGHRRQPRDPQVKSNPT